MVSNMNITPAFGETIRSLWLKQGFSQESFGDKCGMHRTYIGIIERGEINVTLATANKLAVALNISLSQLILEMENLIVE